MIVNGVVRFIKTLLTLVVKGAAWLLFALGLWLPCLYCIVFLLVCAFTGTAISAVLRLFIVGLTLCVIGGIVLSYYIDAARKRRAQVVKQKARAQKTPRTDRVRAARRERDGEYASEADGEDAQAFSEREARGVEVRRRQDFTPIQDANTFTGNTKARQSDVGDGADAKENPYLSREYESGGFSRQAADGAYGAVAGGERNTAWEQADGLRHSDAMSGARARQAWESAAAVSDTENRKRLHEKYFYPENSLLDDDAGRNYDYESAAKKRFERLEKDDEQPLIFRSRRDKDIYIYEFSNRLHIYRKTTYGMQLLEVRAKNGTANGGQRQR